MRLVPLKEVRTMKAQHKMMAAGAAAAAVIGGAIMMKDKPSEPAAQKPAVMKVEKVGSPVHKSWRRNIVQPGME